jgi:hypothetical protein
VLSSDIPPPAVVGGSPTMKAPAIPEDPTVIRLYD